MNRPAHIVVESLTHVYAAATRPLTALENVSLEVGRGSFMSVLGPSGDGKTTLLRAIGGLLEPTAGTIRIDGSPPSEARRRKASGFVFQDPSLLPWRTVLQNVVLPLELRPRQSRSNGAGPERWLETVGLADFADYYPHQLSGGMRQRLSFARALVMDPDVLLMDEPLGALDEITRTAMRYELLRVWEETPKTVLLVTHSIPEAIMMSDYVAVFSSRPGRVLRVIRIDLPRPREQSLERSDVFLDYTEQIRAILSSEVPRGASALRAAARK